MWAQLQAHLNSPGATVLEDSNLVRWFLDTDVRFPEVHQEHGVRDDINLEPLLVNTVGSWAWRPQADTAIENLFLASDYVRTYTDLATMEGANEAARRAVNAILDRSGSTEPKCRGLAAARAGDIRAGPAPRPVALPTGPTSPPTPRSTAGPRRLLIGGRARWAGPRRRPAGARRRRGFDFGIYDA